MQDVRDARDDVLSPCFQRGVAQSGKCMRLVETVVVKTPSNEEAMIFGNALVEPRRQLIRVQLSRRRE